MVHKCRYCGKEYDEEDRKKYAGHMGGCLRNPKAVIGLKKRIIKQIKKRDYILNCKKCNKKFKVSCTPYKYKIGKYTRHCSQKCSNSKIQSKETNLKRSITIKEKIRKGLFTPACPFKKGKLNLNYKEKGCERRNFENKLETFDKYNGVCQRCSKSLNKKETAKWHAHHNKLLLTQDEYNESKDRLLLCRSCHTILHNKTHPKKRKTGSLRIRQDTP